MDTTDLVKALKIAEEAISHSESERSHSESEYRDALRVMVLAETRLYKNGEEELADYVSQRVYDVGRALAKIEEMSRC